MLTDQMVLTVMQDGISTIIAASLPMLIIALVVGLIISIFQATTQINEQTMSFVPKILAIFAALLIFGGFILGSLRDYALRIFEYIGTWLS